MKKENDWEKVFTTDQPCDFCENEDTCIMRVEVRPTWRYNNKGELQFSGVIFSKLCADCIAEKIDSLDDEED